ncbi:rhythmically expressed gene 2 protein-like [Pectinophora gossypiella]|uniref:rhythmically expressed gene 2 protein-like n=1 Tax=Pectinophora gossypiella TaxID=13191 RepID=UPI00214E609C|nr:rhythmically expressed gene 2 protein-like [Pectinophora gossypiella]
MSLKGIKLVTFDATNTLLKFRVPPWQHYAVVARDHGFTGTADDLKHRLLDSYKNTWTKYPNFGKCKINWDQWWTTVVKMTFDGLLPMNTDIEHIASRLIEEFSSTKCWRAVDGSNKLIQTLQDNGFILGVISNFDPRLTIILKSVKMNEKFDFILTSYESGYSKPDVKIFKYALEMCEKCTGKIVKPSESLHIGDDIEKDYHGARAAGWHALLISQNIKSETPPALNHVFKNLEELGKAIQNKTIHL